jgi:hypothetical protein
VAEGRGITTEDINNNGKVDLTDPIVDFIDPGSGRRVATRQTNVVLGANAIPNGIDVGYVTGYNYTYVATYRIPWWPRPRNKK